MQGRSLMWQLRIDTIPSPADLPDPGIKPGSLAWQVDSSPTKLSGKPNKSGPYLHFFWCPRAKFIFINKYIFKKRNNRRLDWNIGMI